MRRTPARLQTRGLALYVPVSGEAPPACSTGLRPAAPTAGGAPPGSGAAPIAGAAGGAGGAAGAAAGNRLHLAAAMPPKNYGGATIAASQSMPAAGPMARFMCTSTPPKRDAFAASAGVGRGMRGALACSLPQRGSR